MRMSNARRTPINGNTTEKTYLDPVVLRQMTEQTHHKRNLAIREGFAWLRDRLTVRLHRSPGRWIERLG